MKTWGTVGTVSRILTFESIVPYRHPFDRTLTGTLLVWLCSWNLQPFQVKTVVL